MNWSLFGEVLCDDPRVEALYQRQRIMCSKPGRHADCLFTIPHCYWLTSTPDKRLPLRRCRSAIHWFALLWPEDDKVLTRQVLPTEEAALGSNNRLSAEAKNLVGETPLHPKDAWKAARRRVWRSRMIEVLYNSSNWGLLKQMTASSAWFGHGPKSLWPRARGSKLLPDRSAGADKRHLCRTGTSMQLTADRVFGSLTAGWWAGSIGKDGSDPVRLRPVQEPVREAGLGCSFLRNTDLQALRSESGVRCLRRSKTLEASAPAYAPGAERWNPLRIVVNALVEEFTAD